MMRYITVGTGSRRSTGVRSITALLGPLYKSHIMSRGTINRYIGKTILSKTTIKQMNDV